MDAKAKEWRKKKI